MNINPITYKPNFGRAFTTQESIAYSNLLKDARGNLNLEDTSAIIFDFNIPSQKGKNTAIGTTWSQSMIPFIQFTKKMTGINSIQLSPQGKIKQGNTSPYSGTTFTFGEHIIDLSKLTSKRYGKLLSPKYIKDLDKNYSGDKHTREYRTDYPYVLGAYSSQGIQDSALNIAFSNFKKGLEEKNPQIIRLNQEFNSFKQENKDWLEKESLFIVLSNMHSTENFRQWPQTDKDLFSSKIDENIRQKRIQEIKEINKEEIEYLEFVQFLADKEQKESHSFSKAKDIKLYGDCLIGFSESELWSNKDCFRENLYYGGPDPDCSETNYIQAWGLPALDYSKLGNCPESGDTSNLGETGKLLFDKYTTFFKRYDGIRVDAAWQFVTPFVYQAINGTYQEVEMPAINNIIFNIMSASAKKAHSKGNIMLEMLGLSADKGREITKNIYPHLYSTAYAEYDENPAKFIQKGYEDNMFYAGVGNHDNDSLINMATDRQKRNLHLKGIKSDYHFEPEIIRFNNQDYKNQSEEQRIQEDFRTVKLAEVFTAPKQFFTLPDMFGMSERINISGKSDGNNWTVRIPTDYERFYFSQLSNGYGINMPKILAVAMSMKQTPNNDLLISKCNEAAEILREKGPMTQAEADIAEKDGNLKRKFEYIQ